MIFGPRPEIKSRAQLRAMAEAGHIVHAMLQAVRDAIEPGISTLELDSIAEKVCREEGARPNFKGYHGFPGTICASVNAHIVHGIPSADVVLEPGDVVSIDCGCSVAGPNKRRWHGDSAATFIVPPADPLDQELSDVTRNAMWAGIAALVGATRVGVVGEAIEAYVHEHPVGGAELGIVEEFVGHGIGSQMHQPPDVVNFASRDHGARIRSGMAICVEPMLTRGSPANRTLDDDWTVVTQDGSRAAHWEQAIALVDGGIRILTLPDGGAAELARFGISPVEL